MSISPASFDRRRFLFTTSALCLGVHATAAPPPKDDTVKARMAVRFDSPDGRDCIEEAIIAADRSRVVILETDMNIRVWDAATGNWVATLTGHKFEYTHLFAVVNSGRTLLAWNGFKGTCLTWDLKNGGVRAVFQKAGQQQGASLDWGASASHDGKRIATGHAVEGMKVLVRGWDVATGKELWEFTNPNNTAVQEIAFSPDGKHLAIGTDDAKLKLLDPATGKETAAFSDGKFPLTEVCWSDDGKRVAGIQKNVNNIKRLVAWDAATGKIAGVVDPLEKITGRGSLSPDGKHFAAPGSSGTVLLWTVPGETPITSLKVIGRHHVAWSADGKSILVVRGHASVYELLTFDLADILPKK